MGSGRPRGLRIEFPSKETPLRGVSDSAERSISKTCTELLAICGRRSAFLCPEAGP